MNIKIYKDRDAIQLDNDVFGTQHENEVTTLKIEVPEQYENWNKRIVFITDEGTFWDAILDNTYTIKNNITKYEEVEAYIWLTENAENEQESINDFRSKTFKLSFFENETADDLAPSVEQVDGFNTMLTTLNLQITKVEDLEKELQKSEKARDSKVNTAVQNIKDLTNSYNENAQKKTTDFNNNASEKQKTYDDNTEKKEKAYNDNAEVKEKNYNNLAEEKETELNELVEGVKNFATAIQLPQFYVDKEMKVHVQTATNLSNVALYIKNGKLMEGVREIV